MFTAYPAEPVWNHETSVAHEAQTVTLERERIARDLHDTAIQELFAAGLLLQSAAVGAPSEIRGRLADVVDQLDGVIRDIRMTIFGLTDRRHGAGLTAQAGAVVAEAARMLGFVPSFDSRGAVDSHTSSTTVDQLVPTLREALSNVARHARASTVTITLEHTGPSVVLCVTDNGVGLGNSRSCIGDGMHNLLHRAEQLGGSMTLVANTSGGSIFTWSVPASPDCAERHEHISFASLATPVSG